MLNQLWQSISMLGLTHPRLAGPDQPSDLAKKLVLCNRISATMGLMTFSGSFIFWSSPGLFAFYLLALLTFILPLLLNFLGYFAIARLLLSFSPAFYAVVGSGLTTSGPAISQQVAIVATVVLPVLLFQLTEPAKLWIGISWVGLLVLFFEPVTSWIPRLAELTSDQQAENALTRTVVCLYSYAVITAAFLHQQRINYQAENQLATTLELAQNKTLTIQSQHDQLQRQLQEIERQSREIQLMNRTLRMQALKAQINPHFVFNALNSIQHFVVQKNTLEALSFLTKFAKLIRQVLENSVNERIPVDDEIKALRYYIDLERLRFNNGFAYQIEIDQTLDVHTTEIPSMLLQPYVENAILHGLRHRSSGQGQLTVCLLLQTDHLLCVIEDNGIGRQAARQFGSDRTHIARGTAVTDTRLRLLSPEGAQPISVITLDLYTDTHQPRGTRVELVIPL